MFFNEQGSLEKKISVKAGLINNQVKESSLRNKKNFLYF